LRMILKFEPDHLLVAYQGATMV